MNPNNRDENTTAKRPHFQHSEDLLASAKNVNEHLAEFEEEQFDFHARVEIAKLSKTSPHLEDELEEELAATARLVPHGYIARDAHFEPIVAYFPKHIAAQTVEESHASIKAFVTEYAQHRSLEVDDAARHSKSGYYAFWEKIFGSIHLGTWHARGHEHEDPVVTLSCVRSSWSYVESVKLMNSLSLLTTELSVLLCVLNVFAWYRSLDLYALLCRYFPAAEWSGIGCKWEPWSCRAFLFNLQTEGHRDGSDDKHGYAAITVFGSFTGGEFVIPELKIKFPIQPGDVIFLKSQLLIHFITAWQPKGPEGERYSVVHFNHQSIVDWVDKQCKGFKDKHYDSEPPTGSEN